MNNQEREAMRQLWISWLADLGDSGMTQDEWCKSRRIPYSSLRYWITKLRKESLTDNQAAQWLKVDVAALYYKRRERGRFCWPSSDAEGGPVDVTMNDLNRLLDGLLMEKFIPHKTWIPINT